MPLAVTVLLTWFAVAAVVAPLVGGLLAFGNLEPARVPRRTAPTGG